jgi:tRNA (mo5U34)-methyltransferase
VESGTLSQENLTYRVNAVDWYHTIDLGNGIVTPGFYDHRPYLKYYGIPENLQGKTVLDIGAASGFFSFEFERRGARVTAIDLPEWFDHDFGPEYQFDRTDENGQVYLHQPFDIAREALRSKVRKQHINIYDISPKTVGVHDLAFCGSLLIHLTDPIKALWNIAEVTREKAIIAMVVSKEEAERPIALMIGHQQGDGWWIPTRACLELMAVSAGFMGIEWVSEFQLDYRDGSPGPYHGVLHAYKTLKQWTPQTLHRDEILAQQQERDSARAELGQLEAEVERLRALVAGYEQGRFMRFMQWLHRVLGR